MIDRRPGFALAGIATLLASLAPGAAGAAVPDPDTRGPVVVERVEYRAGSVRVSDDDGTPHTKVRLRGDLHFPATGAGPFPALLFIHGNHSTCETGGLDGVNPFGCREGEQSLPIEGISTEDLSYRGYDYIGANLASHGYVVMSIDTNEINDWGGPSDAGIHARTQLIAASLDLLSDFNATAAESPVGDRLVGRVDLERLGLMGHSRGGEAVSAFPELNRTRTDGPRYGVDAVFALAPTDFAAQKPTGVAYATALPYCDGDVFNLQGAWIYERSKAANSALGFPHVQFAINSANHNFFNTEWELDDAVLFNFADPYCLASVSPTRLSHAEQRRVGLTLIGGFLRRYVGGEKDFEPLATGAELPAYACPDPAPVGPDCDDVVLTSYVAPAGDRRTVIEPGATNPIKVNALGGELAATGFETAIACTPSNRTQIVGGGSGCGSQPNRSQTRQLTLAWTSEASLSAEIPETARNVKGFEALHLRAATNFNDPLNLGLGEQDFAVRLTDTAGQSAAVSAAAGSAALEPSAGTTSREVVLNGIRIPLGAFEGVDLERLASLRLEFGARTPRGSIQLADVAFQE